MNLQSKIDELLQYGTKADDEEMEALKREQNEILSQFDSIMEATSRRAAVEDWYPRHGLYWADMDDDDGGFWEECFLVGSLSDAKDDANADFVEGNETGAVIAISLGSSEPWENIDTTSSFYLPECLAPRGGRNLTAKETGDYPYSVNVGAEVIGRLNIARKYTDQLSAGQYLPDVVVERIDLQRKKLGLTMADPEAILDSAPITVADLLRREAQVGRNAAAATSQAPTTPPSTAVLPAPRPPGPPQKSQEAGLRVGEFVDGVVVEVSAKVIMVDIGLGHLAALAVPAALRSQFQVEDEIQGMRVERVDWDETRQKGAVVLSLDEPELAVDEAETSFNSDKVSWERHSEPGDVASSHGSWYDWHWSNSWDWRRSQWGDWHQGPSWWHRPYWAS
ncbi:unnamed protein product [Symbiodinium microadriaticum]|nr:unnamed protein product [Symbiodinium microadriaticum]